MKRTMMLILKRLPFPFPEHRINDLPEPRYLASQNLVVKIYPKIHEQSNPAKTWWKLSKEKCPCLNF
ncbi:unnamed protein product [Prunus armeniaca]|uniref:Uncharacterized protein n=1 Tax=Prunus armeniaca TaxID=36596 RepID=A0A6J5TEK6_PRUAR|nr:unnamed protein product [Prunus armeniaca]